MDVQRGTKCMFWVLLILCFCVKLAILRCNPSDPPVVERISLNQLTGRWFSLRASLPMSPVTIPPDLFLDALSVDIRSHGHAIINGRPAGSPKSCLYQPTVFKQLDERKNSYQVNFDFRGETNQWRFISLLRGRYLVTWVCIKFDVQRKCTQYIGNIFSRKPKPIPNSALRVLNRDVRKTLCADIFRDYTIDPFTNGACPRVEVIQDGQFKSRNWFQIRSLNRRCRY